MKQLARALKHLSAELKELRGQNQSLRALPLQLNKRVASACHDLQALQDKESLLDQKIEQIKALDTLLEERSRQPYIN